MKAQLFDLGDLFLQAVWMSVTISNRSFELLYDYFIWQFRLSILVEVLKLVSDYSTATCRLLSAPKSTCIEKTRETRLTIVTKKRGHKNQPPSFHRL
jgi:hypothetical protein